MRGGRKRTISYNAHFPLMAYTHHTSLILTSPQLSLHISNALRAYTSLMPSLHGSQEGEPLECVKLCIRPAWMETVCDECLWYHKFSCDIYHIKWFIKFHRDVHIPSTVPIAQLTRPASTLMLCLSITLRLLKDFPLWSLCKIKAIAQSSYFWWLGIESSYWTIEKASERKIAGLQCRTVRDMINKLSTVDDIEQ